VVSLRYSWKCKFHAVSNVNDTFFHVEIKIGVMGGTFQQETQTAV